MSGRIPVSQDDLVRLHAGALRGAERASVSTRAASDPEARALMDDWDRQDADLRATYRSVLTEPLPPEIRKMLDAARAEDRRQMRRRMAMPMRIAAVFALLAVGGACGFLFARMEASAAATVRLAENATTAYATYVSEIAHPVEVEAARADHLTQWLSKRLGHPIKAPDFASAGFRLMGGRLLPSDSGPAALFMYEDDLGRRITLYIAPGATGEDTAFRFFESGTTQSFYWLDGDLSCAVTGDIPRDTLRQIAVDAYDQLI